MADEIRRLDAQIDQVTDETLDSTRRILSTATDTHKIGVETLVTLNEQGEKLDHVEQNLDEMNVDLKKTEKNLRELEKVCGCCYCPCGNPRSVQKSKKYKKVYGNKKGQQEAVTSQPSGGPGGSGGQGGGNYVKRITNDDREEQMEQNLQAVGNILDNLHGIAVDMGGELERQNQQLGRINVKADLNAEHLGQANRRMQKQL